MKVDALTHVLENVAAFDEGAQTKPIHTFATHLCEAGSVAVHPRGHVMATDSAQGLTTLRHPCGAAMWAAGAKIGAAQHDVGGCRGQHRRRPVQLEAG